MTDFAAPIPVEPAKADYLHERERIPAAPKATIADLARRHAGLALGFVLAMGYMAMAFQTRASWGAHRDWVVPMTVPFWVIGGVALGHLVDRKQWAAAAPGIGLLLVAIVLTGLNDWRGAVTEGSDALRDALTTITAVVLGFSLAALTAALVWVEAARPTKAPAPEA